MLKRGAKLQAWQGPHNRRVQVLITFVVLVLFCLIFLFCNNGENRNRSAQWMGVDSSVELNPVVEFRNGTDVIWQIPYSPKAALFLAHGCNGRAVNFWDRSPKCPNCVGLPEERQLVFHALARNFAVITISSAARCWTLGDERLIVKEIIRWWMVRNNLDMLPLVALGASSGGYFVSALATHLRFSSITLMIAEGIFDQIDITEEYPPTLFVHMPKDLRRQQKIGEYMRVLKSKGIDVAEIKCRELPLSSNFLANRIRGLDPTVSAKLLELFQEKGFVDENGYMKNDGRATRWQEAVRKSNAILLNDNLVHHVQEELNLAFAYHEMTSLPSEQIFKWFESHMN